MNATMVTRKRTYWDARVLFAFAAIYIFWGATFLAIRVAVLEIPPFFTAGLRFFTAGACLFGFMKLRGAPMPTLKQWRNLTLVAICMFVLTYGPLFWAQQYVTSSITAIVEATLPITTIVLEVFAFRSLKLQPRLAAGVLLGFFGIAVLMFHNPGQELAVGPCLVILGSGIAWSFGAVLSGHLFLPASKPLTAGAEMMIGGAVLLVISALHGEMQPFPHITLRAGLALGYLIIFGSLIAYTAYVWLLGRMPASRVASHAYVNPIVALGLGYFFAGEILTTRTVIASIIVLVSVFLILSRQRSN
jgi:drug/metabolite transporter (DMT)-like permease